MKNTIKKGFVPYDDSSHDNFDWSKAKRVTFPNLKPSSTTISLRVPTAMLNQLKVLANKQDVPYQSLMKILLSQALKQVLKHR